MSVCEALSLSVGQGTVEESPMDTSMQQQVAIESQGAIDNETSQENLSADDQGNNDDRSEFNPPLGIYLLS